MRISACNIWMLRIKKHYCVKDPLEVKWCLEYLNAMKSFNRDALKRTAIADGFISA